jgi:hypothetical protein
MAFHELHSKSQAWYCSFEILFYSIENYPKKIIRMCIRFTYKDSYQSMLRTETTEEHSNIFLYTDVQSLI